MIIAIDIGSQNITIAALDGNKNVLKTDNFITPSNASECVDLLKAAIASDFMETHPEAIIIGMPGVVRNNIVQWCSNLGDDWIGLDFATELKSLFTGTILVENDANLGALAESNSLPHTPQSLIFLSIGAGIGSGIAVNGKLHPAILNSEAGMMMLEYDGVVQEWENFASGKAIFNTYNKLAENIKNPAIWDAIADRISRGLLMLIPILQPQTIVIGGSIGESFGKYQQQLKDLIDERLPSNIIRPNLIQAKDPKLSVIYGCFYLYRDAKK